MTIDAAGLPRSSWVAPMRYENVPPVDARYWISITAASVLGCNLGDFVSLYLHWGHWRGLVPLALVFGALILGERRVHFRTQAWYWTTVVVLRTAATNLADLATHSWELPYPWVIACLGVFQVLVILPVGPRLAAIGPDLGGRPATDGWYWLSLLTAGTLGTAIGDCVAEQFHLGTGVGSLWLTAVFILVLLAGRKSRWAVPASYWAAIVAVRAAGTTAGDWLAFQDDPGLLNGLNLGLPISTACSGAVFLAVLLTVSRNARRPDLVRSA